MPDRARVSRALPTTMILLPGCFLSLLTSWITSPMIVVRVHCGSVRVVEATYLGRVFSVRALSSVWMGRFQERAEGTVSEPEHLERAGHLSCGGGIAVSLPTPRLAARAVHDLTRQPEGRNPSRIGSRTGHGPAVLGMSRARHSGHARQPVENTARPPCGHPRHPVRMAALAAWGHPLRVGLEYMIRAVTCVFS